MTSVVVNNSLHSVLEHDPASPPYEARAGKTVVKSNTTARKGAESTGGRGRHHYIDLEALSEEERAEQEAKLKIQEKIHKVKQHIVRLYGGRLLGPTVADQTPLEVIMQSDTEEEKAKKRDVNKEILLRRSIEQQQREPELIAELDRVIGRIKNARQDYKQEDFSGSIYGSSQAVLPEDRFRCHQCGNTDEYNFISDGLKGDIICMGRDGGGCGAIVQDHTVHQGAEKRNFEGEEDRNHFGPVANKLMPDQVNMETDLYLRLNQKDNKNFRRIMIAQRAGEMNLSSLGRDDKHTREGYKTNQKRQVFGKIEEIAYNVNLHHQVVQKAKEEFTKYRDARDALHQLDGVMCGCLVLAYTELAEQNPKAFETAAHSLKVVKDVGALPNSDFGVVADRSAVHDDAAISAVPSLAMGRFGLENVKEWLFAVASHNGADFEPEAMLIFDYVEKLMRDGNTELENNKKRRVPAIASGIGISRADFRRYPAKASNMFGTTTVTNRLSKYKVVGKNGDTFGGGSGGSTVSGRRMSVGSQSSSSTSDAIASRRQHLTAGQQLLRLSMVDVFKECKDEERAVAAEKLFKDAVIRRGKYDALLLEKERRKSSEINRLKTAESTLEMKANLMKRKPKAEGDVEEHPSKRAKQEGFHYAQDAIETKQDDFNSVAGIESGEVEVEVSADDLDLEELVGGPIATVESFSKPPATRIDVKSEQTESRGKMSETIARSDHSIATESIASGKASQKKVGMRPKVRIVYS